MSDSDRTKEDRIEELNRLRAAVGQGRMHGAPAARGGFVESGGAEEWQIMMDMLGDFLFVFDTRGYIIKSNPYASSKLGYSSDDLRAMNIFDLYPPDRRTEAEETYSQIMAGDKFLCEIPLRAGNGSLIAVETKVSPGKWRGENVIFSISRDVSAGKAVEYELRLAYDKMKTIVNSAPAYIWSGINDPGGKFSFIFQSPALLDVAGRPPGFFQQGLDIWFGIVHAEDRERVSSLYRTLMSGGSEKEDVNYRIIHSDGGVRWVRDIVLARVLGDGKVRLDGIIMDITERRMALQALGQSESRLEGILSSMADIVFAFDTETRFVFYHTPDPGGLYLSPERFIGRKVGEVMPADITAQFNDAFRRAATGSTAEYGYGLEFGGTTKYFSAKLSPIMREGIFDGVVAVVRDITEQRMYNETLMASERRYRELFNNIHDGSTLIDMEGRIIDFNQPFESLLGYSREELLRMTAWDITPEKWHEVDKTIIREQILTRGFSDIYRKEYKKKDGTIIPVEVQRCLIRDHAGNPEGMWVIVRAAVPR
ncbi:MAG TPA: PAS domain S-box protein [Spirochaetota bacterium]|nr:PAS domain S-box protein [Spirochaetota bacterium]HOD13897.1 PAS domain S-box protein [Spirochaetota bacterium]HPG49693.1 PAS domain S-box protein [Spirochaetota bacterium]HPN13593.1 PAS domain S-box protein [Spirochaetota bacterium]